MSIVILATDRRPRDHARIYAVAPGGVLVDSLRDARRFPDVAEARLFLAKTRPTLATEFAVTFAPIGSPGVALPHQAGYPGGEGGP